MYRYSIPLVLVLCIFFGTSPARAQTTTQAILTKNLSLGSEGPEVKILQQLLNRDSDTRVASSGDGSPGKETEYFGQRTKAAVIRFQNKYATSVLTPASLTTGNGYVGSYTRAKLNGSSEIKTATVETPPPPQGTTLQPSSGSLTNDYTVKESEKIDIYIGDKKLAELKNRITGVVDTLIATHATSSVVLPKITPADAPGVALGTPSPRSGAPGAYIFIKGSGITTESVLYFGSDHIVRTITRGLNGNFIFIVPPLPPGLYDIAIRTGGLVSNTTQFVITDPKNPLVWIQSVSPENVSPGDTLTITGSGFSPIENTVVIAGQKFSHIPSSDGKTISVPFTSDTLQKYAGAGAGKIKLPMSLYIVNEYGFSDSKTLTVIL